MRPAPLLPAFTMPIMLNYACPVRPRRYKNDRQIQAMTALVAAYQRREVHEAEKIIRENRSTIMDDPFIREHIDAVLRSLRTQWILDIIKPYSRIEVSYLARVRDCGTSSEPARVD